VSGDNVILEVSPRQQRLRSPGVISTQGATTTVTARLGEWFPLGSVGGSAATSTSGILEHGQRNERSDYSVWAKVDEL
jgi:hypothetical protein